MARPLPVVVLARAEQDIDEAVGHYVAEAGADVAERFAAALADAFDLLGRNPGLGSQRYASLLNLPGLRAWPMRPWPQVVFYLEREQQVVVVRVLHGARDIPATLAEAGDE